MKSMLFKDCDEIDAFELLDDEDDVFNKRLDFVEYEEDDAA